jgi:hypothetical protein
MPIVLHCNAHGNREAHECHSVTDAIGLAVSWAHQGRLDAFRIERAGEAIFPEGAAIEQASPLGWGRAWDARVGAGLFFTPHEAALIVEALAHQRRRWIGRCGRANHDGYYSTAGSHKANADTLKALIERLEPFTQTRS